MNPTSQDKTMLRTSAGDFPLNQYCFRTPKREWKILHVNAVLSQEEESKFLREFRDELPYGVMLWASSIALSHEIASRNEDFRGSRVLELGAGTGLPGIVAATSGAQVLQTDRNDLVMSLCKRNVALNHAETIEQRIVDWANWDNSERYDWIIGSDILYREETHGYLRHIFESNLKSGGRILLSDPFRSASFSLLETLETDGWTITISKWSVGEESAPRAIGVLELSPP